MARFGFRQVGSTGRLRSLEILREMTMDAKEMLLLIAYSSPCDWLYRYVRMQVRSLTRRQSARGNAWST